MSAAWLIVIAACGIGALVLGAYEVADWWRSR